MKQGSGNVIDQGLAILFPAPSSFTGEDVLELHLHGSRAVEFDLYAALSDQEARLAEPGEFTLRAMKNGKLDLSQVEALGDLIDSETTLQRMQALGQLEGAVSEHIHAWRVLLLKILTPLAADIDFPDEDDVPAAIAANALPEIDALRAELESALSGAGAAKRIREGAQVVLLGAPNAGKSSLLNRLAGSDIAIVSDQPGTTRDVVEARLDLSGMLVTVADTAGLRDATHDAIEAEGMRRSLLRAREADLRILVIDSTTGMDVPRGTIDLLNPGDVVALNKSDIAIGERKNLPDFSSLKVQQCEVSAITGQGVAKMLELIGNHLDVDEGGSQTRFLTRQRHVDAVAEAIQALDRARENVLAYPELAAEDLRLAERAFSRLVGAVDVEDILGEVFSSFCIGK